VALSNRLGVPIECVSLVETDTLFIEFRNGRVPETRERDENTLLDVDADGSTGNHGRVQSVLGK
jgi:hypothetical protein